MRTGTKVFLIILGLIISGAVVIGVDVYLSYKDVEAKMGEFTVSGTTFDLADNNESVDISTTVSTPKLGYIPKSIRLDITLMKGGSQYGDNQTVTIKLGESQVVGFTVVITSADITTISTGGSIVVSMNVIATPIYIGIPLNFIAQDLGSTDITIP